MKEECWMLASLDGEDVLLEILDIVTFCDKLKFKLQ